MDVPARDPLHARRRAHRDGRRLEWKARMDVKLGPVALTFDTDVRREDADADAFRAVLAAEARDARGRGAGRARIESSLVAHDGGTQVQISTDLTLSGTVAQTGRGLVAGGLGPARAELRRLPEAQLAGAQEEAAAAVAAQAAPVEGPLARAAALWPSASQVSFAGLSADPNSDQGGAHCHRSTSPSTAPGTRQRSSRGCCSRTSSATSSGSQAPKSAARPRSAARAPSTLDGHAVKSCTVLAVQADGRLGHDDRRARRRRPHPSAAGRRSGSNTASSAASARPG